jgi:HMGL-like
MDANMGSNGKYYRENEWWVSPYNFAPEVRAGFQLPERVAIHDATLRDGEQTPGVVMSVADKIAIAEKMAEIGVERIEAGMPAVSEMPSSRSRVWVFGRGFTRLRGLLMPTSIRPSSAAATV